MPLERGVMIGPSVIDEAIAMWWGWCDSLGHLPDWSVFHPFKHPALLPHIVLHEWIDGRIRCAIVGGLPSEHLPVKLHGRFLDEAMPPANLADVTRRLEASLQDGKPNYIEKTMAWKIGYERKSYGALQLPFPERGEVRARVMSVMNFRINL